MWETVKLRDVVCFDKKNGKDSGLPYVGMENIASESMQLVGTIEIPETTSSTFEFDETHVLYGRLRPYLKKVLLPKFKGQCSTEVFCLKPSKVLLRGYLAYWLLNPSTAAAIEKTSTGARMPRANMNAILDFQFQLPPLAEQQRIVAKLDAAFAEIDRAVELAQEAKTIASKIADASVKSALANHYFEWQTIDLGTIAENLDSKRVPITKSKRVEGDVPYYGASGIVDYVDGHLFDEELLLISEDGANLLMRTYPIAFSISGKTWVNNHAHVLRFSDRNTQKWVERYLNATDLTKFISGMAQPKLNQKKLNSISIPLPNEKYMNDLLSVIDMTKQKGDELDKIQSEKALQLVQLKSAILAQELQPPQSEAA